MSDDLRDTITKAVETSTASTPAPSPAPAPVEAPSPSPAAASPSPSEPPAGTPAPAGGPDTPPSPAPAPGEKKDDVEDAKILSETTGSPAPAPAAGPVAPKDNPPGTWTPSAREHWASLPQEVRDTVWKREREASRALTDSAEARRFTNEFSQVVQPFLGFIAAEKATPMQAFQSMMQTAAILRVGTPQQKVQVAVETIRNFGIDLEALDAALAGHVNHQQDPATIAQQAVQRALAPLQQQMQQFHQQQDTALTQSVDAELAAFKADPKHEFFEDVKEFMADLITINAKRGKDISLTEAYESAILMHPQVRQTIEARKTRTSATAAHTAAAAAKNAALSVKPSAETGQVVDVPDDTIRGAIKAAWKQNSERH